MNFTGYLQRKYLHFSVSQTPHDWLVNNLSLNMLQFQENTLSKLMRKIWSDNCWAMLPTFIYGNKFCLGLIMCPTSWAHVSPGARRYSFEKSKVDLWMTCRWSIDIMVRWIIALPWFLYSYLHNNLHNNNTSSNVLFLGLNFIAQLYFN